MDERRPGWAFNSALFVLLQFFIYYVKAVSTDFFSYEYINNDDIVRLRCVGNCTANNNLVNIIIYNSKTMKEMVVWNAGKVPVVFRQSVQDFSYYVGLGFYTEDTPCHLELVITNFKAESPLELRCNTTSSDVKGGIIAKSSPLVINKRAALKDEPKQLSTMTVIILIVVISVLFLLMVFFFSLWVRGLCRYRNKTIYQTPPQSELNHAEVFSGDATSIYSFPKSPSKLNINRRESEFKYPAPTASVRRINSRSESNISSPRITQPPLPPAPPPKPYWRDRTTGRQMSTYCSVKVPYSYSQPQDAIIEPEFSEDGDVTTANNDNPPRLSHNSGSRSFHHKTSFYSSAPVKSVDV